jgi:hypothetical protein
MKHKHYDCIVARANGAKIQWLDSDCDWCEAGNPSWSIETTYRIKPEPKPDYVKIFYLESHPFLGLRFSEEIKPIQEKTKRISCTFDGETGRLKTAEVVG